MPFFADVKTVFLYLLALGLFLGGVFQILKGSSSPSSRKSLKESDSEHTSVKGLQLSNTWNSL